MERQDIRFEFLAGMWRVMLERQLTDQEKGELHYLLDDWSPEDLIQEDTPEGGVLVTLTDEAIADAERQAERRRPAKQHEV